MDSPEPVVESVDGELIAVHKAHKLARRMFVAGFFCLPLLWGFNVWLFWPDFRSGRDAVLSKFTRRSAVCFLVSSLLYFPWTFFFTSAGSRYINSDLYNKLDITRVPIRDYI
ncbi:presenilin enhancer 2, partial [Haematococcus lacustris]